jgi:hypothetical protein
MLIEPDAGAALGYDRCERGLADLFWEVVFWLLIVELARVIGGYSTEEKGNVEEGTARPEHRT